MSPATCFPSEPRARRAMSLIEVTVAVAIIAVLLSGVLAVTGSTLAARQQRTDRAAAMQLAIEMMQEVNACTYGSTSGSITGISSTSGRATFTTIDNYHGLKEKSPTDRSGKAIDIGSGWTRSVTIERVDPLDPQTVVTTDAGLKRITVTVARNGRELALLRGLHALAWDNAGGLKK